MSVAVSPAQMVGLFTVTVGRVLTVTVAVAVLEQPLASVPVMVYTVPFTALSIVAMLLPVPLRETSVIGLQVYEVAPLAVMTTSSPSQTGSLEAVIVGRVFTTMV